MPDQHVEILLDCYKYVLQNRMLSSGRLGKGSFQEVADEMNRRCQMGSDSSYEREQLAAKLQNLKTQFRNRKIAVEEGIYLKKFYMYNLFLRKQQGTFFKFAKLISRFLYLN